MDKIEINNKFAQIQKLMQGVDDLSNYYYVCQTALNALFELYHIKAHGDSDIERWMPNITADEGTQEHKEQCIYNDGFEAGMQMMIELIANDSKKI